ncbi:MAG TPA: hypothetical protein VLC46_10050 [Thermoanaerobaculia bacterium]|nr:hypothetical protein [Thermoanaerobaculia bacterium]
MPVESSTVIAVAARYLSAGAADVYTTLLDAGSITIGSELESTYLEAATMLEEYGFAYRRNTEWGYELLPTPGELLVPSLLYRLEWAYPPFGHPDRRTYEEVRVALEHSLDGAETASVEVPAASQTLVGAQIDAFVARVIVDSAIVRALSAAEWSSNLPLRWSAITEGMRDGMEYHRVVSPLGLAAFGWDINRRDVHDVGIDLRVSLRSQTSPFYLFANSERSLAALVFVPPMGSRGEPRATYTHLAELTNRFLEIFNGIWKDAVPATYVLEQLRLRRQAFIDAASDAGGARAADVAATLFDKGIFAEVSATDEAVSTLVARGLVIFSRYTIGLTSLVPNLTDTIADIVRGYGASS